LGSVFVPRKFSPFDDRLKVYELVREAVNADRYKGPAPFVKELEGKGIQLPSRDTIRRWASGAASPLSGKRVFDKQPSEDLSFFLGAWIGDGWADENDGGKRMLLKVRSYDFAKEFAVSAAKILHKTDSYWVRRVQDRRGRWYLVKVTSFQLYDFVTGPFADLQEVLVKHPTGFLRGIFTAEGNPSVSIEQRRGPRLEVGLSVSNSDRELMEFLRMLLFDLGLHPGGLRLNTGAGTRTNMGVATKDVWTMNLSRIEEVEVFARKIGFADSSKQHKLEHAISLVQELGHKAAASEWTTLYTKRGHAWVRSESTVS
jgi:intein-encoded DNA endonuclease-like protein